MTVDLLLSDRGKRLWAALAAQDSTLDDAMNPLREVALSACRTADRVEELERIAANSDPVVDVRGSIGVHPVFAEVRHQEAALARLITALRLPDEATGRRPQRRAMRGAQAPSALGSIPSLDELRQRARGA